MNLRSCVVSGVVGFLAVWAVFPFAGARGTMPEVGGVAEVQLAAEDDAVVLSRLELVPELEVYSEEKNISFVASLRLRADGSDRVAPGQPPYRTFASVSRPLTLGGDVTAELRDFYMDFELGGARVRLGKQQIVWGQLDGFKLLDQVNPQSFEQFILEDFDSSRIGLWSVSTELDIGGATLQLVYSPDTSVHDIPLEDATYAFRAPRLRFGAPADAPAIPLAGQENDASAGVFAARLSGYVGGWDLAAVALSGPDHSPLGLMTLEGSFPMLSRLYKRRTLLGASASTSFGSFVFRGETGYMPDRHMNVRLGGTLGTAQAGQLTVAGALDYDAPGGLFLSAQLIYDVVLDAPVGLTRPADDIHISLYVHKYFRNETIKISGRLYAANGLFADALFRAQVVYELSDDMSVDAGVDLFFGDSDGLYGQFAERDRLAVTLRHHF